MKIDNVTLFEEDFSKVEDFNSIIERRYPNFKVDAHIFDNTYLKTVKNTQGLSEHECIFVALKGFLEEISKDETKRKKPIVIYDAFFLFDEGKNISELYEYMSNTNRPIFIHVPKGSNLNFKKGDKQKMVKILEDSLGNKYMFEYQCDIKAEVNENGDIITYNPADKYKKKASTNLNDYGNSEFCYLSKMNLCKDSGVYAVYEDDKLIYIGRAKNLCSRWSRVNYGAISPKNCYLGGQSTNCKINSYICERLKEGKKLELYFYKAEEYINVESVLLDKYSNGLSLNKQKSNHSRKQTKEV